MSERMKVGLLVGFIVWGIACAASAFQQQQPRFSVMGFERLNLGLNSDTRSNLAIVKDKSGVCLAIVENEVRQVGYAYSNMWALPAVTVIPEKACQ